jgi:serine/threonine-protein kinase
MSEQTVFNGRYELHRRLARGGMADVFLARDQLLDRPVAVKVLFSEYASDPSFVERFRREAQNAANLNHPNVVSVFDWGEENGTYFIVMEYAEGRTLADILRAEGPLHPQRAAEVASDIAAALGFAHRNGVIHRDVKPANVMVSPTGQVKVADFGIARALSAPVEENLTQAGSVMGTASYFSPEQAQGHKLDPRSDLYSLGVVLYEMLTGRQPFTGESPVAIAYKHVQEPVVPPRQLNANLPPDIEAITLKLLSKSPDGRYASADDLRADLRRFRDGMPTAAATAVAAGVGAAAGAAAAAGATRAVPQSTVANAYGTGATRMPPGYQDPQDEWYDEPPNRNGRYIAIGAAILLLIALLAFLGIKALDDDNGGDGVAASDTTSRTVPSDLKGKPVAEAEALLRELDFVVPPAELRDDLLVPLGTVIDSSPPGGTVAKQGDQVKLIVSAGPPKVSMPVVVGKPLNEARALLTSGGFLAENITTTESPAGSAEDVGKVSAQDPAPSSPVIPKDTPVRLTVLGAVTTIPVPDVSNLTDAEARTRLTTDGFTVPASKSETSASVVSGRVIRTEPDRGTQLARGSAVTLVVSSGAAPVTVPDVKGLKEPNATKRLQDAGFKVKVEHIDADGPIDPDIDTVVDQSPAANEKAAKDTEVTIVILDRPDLGD